LFDLILHLIVRVLFKLSLFDLIVLCLSIELVFRQIFVHFSIHVFVRIINCIFVRTLSIRFVALMVFICVHTR
jgi:hypothetical protein